MTDIYELPPLPFSPDALQGISAATVEVHHGKHHRAYVDKLNVLIRDSPLRGKPLSEVVKKAGGALFNNAAQAWNHEFYWNCLTPNRGAPNGRLLEWINRDFGSVQLFVERFRGNALAKFGSGWTWLVLGADASLSVENSDDADTPLRHGRMPLLTCDVWEHAYYLDYRNERAKYVEIFLEQVNWNFVQANLAAAAPLLQAAV